jgi:hypothetical protein
MPSIHIYTSMLWFPREQNQDGYGVEMKAIGSREFLINVVDVLRDGVGFNKTIKGLRLQAE